MAIRFYMDVHVPAAITQGLRHRGVDVLTSQDDGSRQASDEVLLRRAGELGRVLFSQDHDLLRIAHEWQSRRQPFPGVVFVRQHGASVGQTIADLELIAQCCRPDELANQVIFLPLN